MFPIDICPPSPRPLLPSIIGQVMESHAGKLGALRGRLKHTQFYFLDAERVKKKKEKERSLYS